MIGYPYIQQLFQTILNASKVIRGNFFVCPKWGSEMANPNIDESLAIGQAKPVKYPAALLMPPPKEGNFEYLGADKGSGSSLYDVYNIKLLFVAANSSTGQNQVQQPNNIQESTHTIPMVWHDMDRCAQNFMSALHTVVQPLGGSVIVWDAYVPKISLITNLGNDSVSGVLLMFKLGVFSGCAMEDYADPATITAPPLTDIHPSHSM